MVRPSPARRDAWLAAAATGLALVALGAWSSGLGTPGVPALTGWKLTAASVLAWWGLLLLGIACFRLGRGHAVELLLAAASLAATLTAFDLWARRVELPAGLPVISPMGLRSRELHHGYPPDRTLATGLASGARLVFHTNQDGLRTGYGRDDFRGHALRIAVLGDSFTFGPGVADGAPWPERLEAALRRPPGSRDLAVLNAGVVSYSPFLERLLFERVVVHYAPQLVLVLLDATDIGDDRVYTSAAEWGAGRPSFPIGPHSLERFRHYGPLWQLGAPLRRVLWHPFACLAGMRAVPPSVAEPPPLRIGGREETNPYFIYRHPLAATRPHFERTLDELRALAAAVGQQGARFALVVAPRYQHWNPRECPRNWELFRYAPDEPHQYEYFRFFEEARSRVDFPILNLLPAFQTTDEFPLVFEDDPHWNERGHDFVARVLVRELVERALIPGG